MRVRSYWGWGYEDETLDEGEIARVELGLAALSGGKPSAARPRPSLDPGAVAQPRVQLPGSLEEISTAHPRERASHALGKSYRDIVRATRSQFDHPPDAVVRPRTEEDVVRVLEHCSAARIAVVPYGGGSSVAGGVEPDVGDAFAGAVSLDLGHLDRVLEIDEVSLSARIQAGALGPRLEDQLRPSGLSLRHYPQSFEFSSLGGWIATRAGGHFATLATHIDELVQSVRVVTPSGVLETRRLPGSGAGPSPERLFTGSEGAFGVITEAWMRVSQRPCYRASATVLFDDFFAGAIALRALAQSGLYPANCRLLDPLEAGINGAGDGASAVLIVGFESADHPLSPWLDRALELARDHGGRVGSQRVVEAGAGGATADDAASRWRRSFLRGPYLRDALILRDVFVETYETAVTWGGLEPLVVAVRSGVARALGASPHLCTCRVTHVYPDGPAPYFTVITPARVGDEVAQWWQLKDAITEAILGAGGTVTHHHAVGRDVRRYYERERPERFGAALEAVKRSLDPSGIMNPGVLLPPR